MKIGPWTAEEDAIAIQYLSEHKTFLDISVLMGRPRNAIISRAARKGWNYPRKRVNAKNVASTYVPPKPADTKPLVTFTKTKIFTPLRKQKKQAQPKISGATLMEYLVENQCRYVYGDARGRLCCGKKTITGRPWCEDHMLSVYNHIPAKTSSAVNVPEQ